MVAASAYEFMVCTFVEEVGWSGVGDSLGHPHVKHLDTLPLMCQGVLHTFFDGGVKSLPSHQQGTLMDPAKRDILNVSALAKAAGCSRQMVHLSLKGRAYPARQLALTLSLKANELTGQSCYEPHDFNPTLPESTRNLLPSVRFIVTNLDFKVSESQTAEELQADNPDDLELLTALHECVWDGQRQLIHEGSTLIELDDHDPDLVDID